MKHFLLIVSACQRSRLPNVFVCRHKQVRYISKVHCRIPLLMNSDQKQTCIQSPCTKEMVQRLIAHDLRSNCAVMRGKRNISAESNFNLQGYLPIEKNNCKTFTLAKNTRRNAKPRNFWPHGRKNFCPFWLLFGHTKSDNKKIVFVNYFLSQIIFISITHN